MSDTAAPKRPRAFRLDEASLARAPAPAIEAAPDYCEQEAAQRVAPAEDAVAQAQQAGVIRRTLLSWGGLFWSALTGILLMAAGLWFVQLIENLFARSPAFGYAGLALIALAVLALLVMALREARAISRQRRIAHIHTALAQAREKDDGKIARAQLHELLALYGERAQTARGRAHLNEVMQQ
ncbi:MAG: TIGR01620 family protein, partial [Alphaproteobacteria bacterium]|nr:TIGR01620 family protein [Alphaproteobacteria bacterium]